MKGHVIIKNKKNEILLDKDNMVLNNGRKFLRDILLYFMNMTSEDSTFSREYPQLVVFNTAAVNVNADDTEAVVNNNSSDIVKYKNMTSENISYGTDTSGNYYIKFTLLVSSLNLTMFNSLGIKLNNKLLTRIAFDTVFLTDATDSFAIDYYLYF